MFLKSTDGSIGIVLAESEEAVTLALRHEDSPRWVTETYSLDATPGDPDSSNPLSPLERFKRRWQPWEPRVHPLTAPEPVHLDEVDALRRIVSGTLPGVKPRFDPGVLDLIAEKFPVGPHHLFDLFGGLVHRFRDRADAELVARARVWNKDGTKPFIFSDAATLAALPRDHLEAVVATFEDQVQLPATIKPKLIKELYDMAAKTKKSAKKTNSRTDGPVAKVWSAFDKVSNKQDTSAMLSAASKAGINEATAKTQLYKYRKEKKIKSVRASKPAAKKVKKAGKKAAKKSRPISVKVDAAKVEKRERRKTKAKPLATPTTSPASESAPQRAPQNDAGVQVVDHVEEKQA
jgi:hypothetical protein